MNISNRKEKMHKVIARKVTVEVPESVISRDLECYRQKAIESGATDALSIHASIVPIDDRVRLKCLVPRCHLYGETPNCPPHMPSMDETRKALAKYHHAILFKNEVPVEHFAHPENWHKDHMQHQGKTDEIASLIEALAFNDGYYLAAGFGAGGCKTALCKGQVCQFIDSGRCRFPLKARPSMEAMGIDVFNLVTKVGWEIYPIAHREVALDSIKCAISVGIVFIH